MTKKSEFVEFIKEILEPQGMTSTRAMFGGYGLYKDVVIFGVIIDDELYFKASKQTEEIYKKRGSSPFSYQGKNGLVKMNYWKVDAGAYDDKDLMEKWVEVAFKSMKDK